MQFDIKNKDVWLLLVVALMAFGANLPDSLASQIVDRNLLLAALTVTVFISLFRYLKLMLFLTVSVLAIGANLPEQLAEQFHISRTALIVASTILIVVAALYKLRDLHQVKHDEAPAPQDETLENTVQTVAVSHFRDTVESRFAILSAIMNGDFAALHQLLISDVEVNFSQEGHIPIFLAVERGNVDMVLLLLMHGAKLRIKNQQGHTPIDVALRLKLARIAKILHYANTQNLAIQNRALYSAQQSRKMAVLFADICGSTALYDKLGNETALNMVTHTLNLLKHEVARHKGTLVKTIGDEIMCTFPNAMMAAQAACAMQHAVANNQPNAEHPVAVRIGLHFGDVILKANDIFGDTVNVAARISSITRAHQILTTREIVEALPEDFDRQAVPIARASLKGKPETLEVFQLMWQPGEASVLRRIGDSTMRKLKAVGEDISSTATSLESPQTETIS